MDAPPTPPPEARVLRVARIGHQMSVREAAQRAGVSVSLWRQVEAGYMTPTKGMHTPKIAPAPTLARMAKAVNLSVEDLESEGRRPDAAEILREIIRQRNTDGSIPVHQQAGPANEPSVSPTSLERGADDLMPDMDPETRALVDAHYPAIAGLATLAVVDSDTAIPRGEQVFPDSPHEAERWDTLVEVGLGLFPEKGGFSLWQLVRLASVGRVRDDERRAEYAPVRYAPVRRVRDDKRRTKSDDKAAG
jgi:transcriptional regulator with XRE-family HTH domain